VLYYGAETWRPTGTSLKKIQTFVSSCLKRILKIQWPDTISNLELLKQTSQIAVREEILQRKWRWLGHTLRKTTASLTRQAITWNPLGKRRRGRSKFIWQRSVESQMMDMSLIYNLNQLTSLGSFDGPMFVSPWISRPYTKNHMTTKCGVRDEGNKPRNDYPKTEIPGRLLWVAYAPVKERKGVD
jgi:hypothetical protein